MSIILQNLGRVRRGTRYAIIQRSVRIGLAHHDMRGLYTFGGFTGTRAALIEHLEPTGRKAA